MSEDTEMLVAATLAAAAIGTRNSAGAKTAVKIFNDVVKELAENAYPPMSKLRDIVAKNEAKKS